MPTKQTNAPVFSELDSQVGSVDAPRSSTSAGRPQKDVYTLILLLSFLFFVAATVLLYLDLASYK